MLTRRKFMGGVGAAIAGGVAAMLPKKAAGSTNTWRHACGVFAASNERRVYIDGGMSCVERPVILCWNRALSDAEIKQLFEDSRGLCILEA